MRTSAFAAALVLLVAAGTGCESSKSAFRPSVASAECPADVGTFLLVPHSCGYLTVLEDRRRSDGPTIRLFYLRVQPRGGPAAPDPIASVGYEIAQSPAYGDIVGVVESSNRELILLDQRGTGHSEPSLACPEIDEVASDLLARPLSSVTVRNTFEGAVAACRARLGDAGVRPEAYTLRAAAQDLDDLRRALGVSRWNLISWGTASRVLLEYARLHRQAIRALVLDSPQFPELDPSSETAGDMTEAFRALTETCGASQQCQRQYPALSGALAEAAAALERSPISASVKGEDVVVDGAAFVRVVRHLLSDSGAEAWGVVPRIVYRALDGDVRRVASELVSDPGMCIGYFPRCTDPISLGTYLSFTCPDAPASREGPDPYAEGFGEADPYLIACHAWRIEPNDERPAPVKTDVPVLLLRGEYDGFSPLSLVRRAKTTMPNAHVVLVPHLGHDVLGHVGCLREVRSAWLLHPQNDPKYSACLETITAPTFAKR